MAPPGLVRQLADVAAAQGLIPSADTWVKATAAAGPEAGGGLLGWRAVWSAVCGVWASKWTDRAWLSRRAMGIPEQQLYMSVLLQQVGYSAGGGVGGSRKASPESDGTYGASQVYYLWAQRVARGPWGRQRTMRGLGCGARTHRSAVSWAVLGAQVCGRARRAGSGGMDGRWQQPAQPDCTLPVEYVHVRKCTGEGLTMWRMSHPLATVGCAALRGTWLSCTNRMPAPPRPPAPGPLPLQVIPVRYAYVLHTSNPVTHTPGGAAGLQQLECSISPCADSQRGP